MMNHVGIETSQRHTEQTPAELPNKAVRIVRIGTSAHLLQLGLWGEVMEYLCYFRNVRDKLADRKSTPRIGAQLRDARARMHGQEGWHSNLATHSSMRRELSTPRPRMSSTTSARTFVRNRSFDVGEWNRGPHSRAELGRNSHAIVAHEHARLGCSSRKNLKNVCTETRKYTLKFWRCFDNASGVCWFSMREICWIFVLQENVSCMVWRVRQHFEESGVDRSGCLVCMALLWALLLAV